MYRRLLLFLLVFGLILISLGAGMLLNQWLLKKGQENPDTPKIKDSYTYKTCNPAMEEILS